MRGTRTVWLAVVVAFVGATAGPPAGAGDGPGVPREVMTAAAASGYTVTDLGVGPVAEVTGITSSAQVVGWAGRYDDLGGVDRRAWVWDPRGGLRYLSSSRTQSYAVGANDRGQVAGTLLLSSGQRVFRWDAGGGMRLMVTPRGYRNADAAGINASGLLVGSMQRRSDGARRGFVWDPRTGVVRIMAPLRGDSSCDAVAINAAGQVVGSSSGTREHAFRWDPRTGTQGLGSLGGDSEASGLNAGGQVIGTSTTRAGQQHAFRWDPGSGMRDLGTLGGTWSQPYGINDAGVVVGQSQTRTGLRAFRWEPRTGMRDLGTLGGAASLAVGITGGGLVIGQADTGSGAAHAFVWDPRRGMRDLGTLPGHAWSAAAVVNGRGQVAGVSAGQVDRAVLFSPRVTVAVRAVSVRTRVHLDVDPNLGSGSWLVRVQRRQADRTWATLPTRYRTWGTAETRTLDLPQGTYRVVVPSQHGYRWAASEAVYLRR